MKIRPIPARELSADLVQRWHEILAATPQLAGPYFRPEFVSAVAAARDDVEIAVLEEAGQVAGFFPFQRTRWNVAQPVGGTLSDYQGVVAAPSLVWQPDELLTACRLSAWEFDHQLTWQTALLSCFENVAPSPYIELTAGYEAWLVERKQPAGVWLTGALRKLRKLERETEDLSFEWHSADCSAFEQLLAWKSAQYLRTGLPDLFARERIVGLLDRIRLAQSPQFRGVLSVLRAGQRLLAVHFGMQAGGTLHYWFPAYDPEESRSSPGQSLLLLMARHAAEHGVTRIDLGKGSEEYKLKLANGVTEVAAGCLDRRPLAATLRRGYSAARDWVKQSSLHKPARVPIRWLRRMSELLSSH
ncbi:MAG: GNAT family N-acetyltransferase [Pirellulaceae bacterium]